MELHGIIIRNTTMWESDHWNIRFGIACSLTRFWLNL